MTRDPMPFLIRRMAEDDLVVAEAFEIIGALGTPLQPGEAEGFWCSPPGLSRFWVNDQPGRRELHLREDPRRYEQGLQARRFIAREHGQGSAGVCATCSVVGADGRKAASYPCRTLCSLTWTYSDHPDYDHGWDSAIAE